MDVVAHRQIARRVLPIERRMRSPASASSLMALYRFEVHDGHHAVTPETIDLPDMAAAQREGVRRAGAALVLDAHAFRPSDDWRLDVTDEAGTLLYRFDVAMTVSPAAKR